MGLVAIACVPQASTTTTTTKVENHESAFPIELEVDSVRQVELMNSQVPQFTTGPDVVNGH